MVAIKGIKDILINSQKSCASHPKMVNSLLNIYLKSEFEEFLKDFTHYLKFLLIHGEKEAVVERSLTFVSKFTTSVKTENGITPEDNDDVDPLLVAVFNFLLKNHDANNKAVRYRVCYLINKMLNNMGEQASIDDDLYSTIYDTMLQRLMDKIPAIRVQAILAIARLQDPTNKECPVIKAYRYHLSMDPNSDVRKAVLNNIAITFQTLPDVLERIKDVKDLVRRQAYLVLAQKVHIRSFTIAQRVLLISDGLKDRSPSVRLVVKKNLLQSWLRLVDGKILDLLSCLDVETSTESAELALENMFEDVPYSTLLENFNVLNKDRLIEIADLKPEAAFCLKCLAKHLKNEKAYEYLDELLPDLSSFCEYIKNYIDIEVPTDIDPQETAVRCMQKEFIIHQLLATTLVFDLSDEVGRKNLGLIARNLILNPSVGESCIPPLCNLLNNLYSAETRIVNVAEIISDLREIQAEPKENIVEEPIPVEMSEEEKRKHKLKIAKVSVQIFQLREELEECVRSLNLEKAQDLKTKLKELEEIQQLLVAGATRKAIIGIKENVDVLEPTDEDEKLSNEPEILSRCLMILCQTLSFSDINSLSSTIRSLHDNLILPCLSSEVPAVRKNAIHALANVCLVSKELTKQHILLFIRISQIDIEEIQIVALKAVFDFLHLYGLEEFSTVAESICSVPGFTVEEYSHSVDINVSHSLALGNMVGNISKMLDSDNSEIRTIVAEGFCKLLLSSRIASPKLFAHLLIMWFNPVTEEDQLLRHMLGVFFPLYATNGSDNADVICQAFIPVIQTIFKAPSRSPISDIDIDDVCEFLISITNPRVVCSKVKSSENVHDTLVFSLCAEILANPDRIYVKCLTQVLNKLSLTHNNYPTLKQIDVLSDKMIKNVRERNCLIKIERFQKSVKSLLKNAPLDTIKEAEMTDQVVPVDTVGREKSMDKTINRKKRTLFNSTSLELCENSESEESLFIDTENGEVEQTEIFTEEIPCITINMACGTDEENTSIDVVSPAESSLKNSELNSTSVKDTSSDSFSDTIVEKNTSPQHSRRRTSVKDTASDSSSDTIVEKNTSPQHSRRRSNIKTKSTSLAVKNVRKRSSMSSESAKYSPKAKKKRTKSNINSPDISSSSENKEFSSVQIKKAIITLRRMSTRSVNKALLELRSESRLTRRSSSEKKLQGTPDQSNSLNSEKKRKSTDDSGSSETSSQKSARKSSRLCRSANKHGKKSR